MKYGVGDWPEANGNHRVVLQVGAPSAAVRAHVLWRRRDLEPESKAVWVIPEAQKERIKNVVCPSITSESGDIVFEPTAGPGTYYCYYKPFTSKGSANNPSIVYETPQDTAAPEWRARHGLDQAGLASGKWRELPQAQVMKIQAINDFHRTDPMELPATEAEMTSFMESVQGLPFVLFPEDRRQPIRMLNAIPVDWIRRTTDQRSSFQGDAQRGEYYAYQIGLFASTRDLEDVQVEFSDLKSENGAMIAAAGMACFNVGGTDSLGKPLQKRVDLSKDRVQPLWCGVQIPENAQAGVYAGKVTVRADKLPAQIVNLAIHVREETVSHSGDDELWRQSRLRWLNSTIGLDDEVFAPFDPVRVEGNTVNVLGRRLRFAASGLPESIVSTFSRSVDATEATPRELLAGPMRFVILRKGETNSLSDWISEPVKRSRPGTGAVAWTVDSHREGFELSCRAKMECDGYVNYWLTLRATKDLEADDIALEIPFRSDAAQYMGGMHGEIRRRTQQWDWTWDVERADNQFWVGDVNAGLQVKLKNVTPDWGIYNLRETGPYRDWVGDGHGGCRMRSEGDEVNVRAFTGPMQIKAGRELHFNFGMLITPVRTLNKNHWGWRYFHKYAASVPVAEVAQTGAKIINVHHACDLNPYINYPFLTTDKLGQYISEAHAAGMKVKIYYTVRELSNHAAEFWALRSLGDEVFPHGPEGAKITDTGLNLKVDRAPKKGSSWLQEHVIYDYEPAWYERLGNGHSDAAIIQKGLSRWHNYYLEGLNYLARNVGIDGLYLDGIGYDREIMKRVRKTLQRANPASLIDFHSGNNYSFCKVPTTTQYMELFPYIDSLWFGEGYDYNESPDYWLFNISGIPYGMFGEMLAGGGNRWRGMLYGMTARQGWGGGPEVPALWKVWDDFGVAEAKMMGYWDPACPVQTDRDDILATAYVREGKMLIALASWAKQPVTCTLRINLDSIGLKPENASLHAPEIAKFQSAAHFKLGDGILVEPGRGQVLILQPQSLLVLAQGITGAQAAGTEFFVAPNGNDANPGTKEKPFKTIQKAAAVMQAGDRCLIRAGTYRETVVPANSGKEQAPITFEAFEGERVVISGTDILPGPWKPYKGEIVASAMPWTLGPGKDMIFVDGVLRVQARHPNTHTTTSERNPPPLGLPPFWPTYGDFTVTLNSPDVTNPTDLNQEEADYWKGAIYVGWHNWAWCLQSGRVEASRKGAITVKHNKGWWFPDSAPTYNDKFKWFNQGYLTGHLHALDQAGEWHQQDGTVYIWPDGDKPMGERVIEAKRRHLAFDLRDRQHIHLKGLRIFASSITMYNADHCVIDGCRMRFTSHFTEFNDGRDGYIDNPDARSDKSAPQRGEVGVYVGGRDNVIKNSVIKYSAGAGLFLAGYRTTVTHCIIHDCGYGGTYVGCIFIAFDPLMTEEAKTGVRGGHTITYNDIYRSSRGLIQITSISGGDLKNQTVYDAMDIGYNWLHDASITGNDSGSIYCWNSRLGECDQRTRWHHNLIWDNWSFTWSALAYPDNASFNVDIHDNVLWYTPRLAAQRKEPPKFFKHNPPGDPKYFNNVEKKNYDGGVAGLKDADYPGGKIFKTGPTIQDEEDVWYLKGIVLPTMK